MDNYDFGRIQCTDHLGNVFKSKKERAKFYNLYPKIIDDRLARGWTLEESLTLPKTSVGNTKDTSKINTNVKDHLGNIFPNKTARAKFYNKTRIQVENRLERGWTLEKALTTPIRCNKNDHTDLTGKHFNTKKELYNYYSIPHSTAMGREAAGWSKERILLTPVSKCKNKYYDDIYNDYITLDIIRDRYKCDKKYSTIKCAYKDYGYKISQIVGVSLIIKSNFNTINKTKYNLTVSKRIQKGKDVFECYIDNGDGTSTFKIMTYDMIDQYCIEQYKKLHNIA